MTEMVELPRNPVDFIIDLLSKPAIDEMMRLMHDTVQYLPETNGLVELVEAGLAEKTPGRYNSLHGFKLTFDGWHSQERYGCGIYHHHKRIYKERVSRDATLQAIPGWGIFG